MSAAGPEMTRALELFSADTVTSGCLVPPVPEPGQRLRPVPPGTVRAICWSTGARSSALAFSKRSISDFMPPLSSVSSFSSSDRTFWRFSALAVTMRLLEPGSATTDTRSCGLVPRPVPRPAWNASLTASASVAACANFSGMSVGARSVPALASSNCSTRALIFSNVSSSARTATMRASLLASMTTDSRAEERFHPQPRRPPPLSKTRSSTLSTSSGSAFWSGMRRMAYCSAGATSSSLSRSSMRWWSSALARTISELLEESGLTRTWPVGAWRGVYRLQGDHWLLRPVPEADCWSVA